MGARDMRRSRRLLGDQDGAILAELMLAMTVLVLLAVGSVELGRYVLLNQKLDRVAASVGDLISQAETLTESDVANMFSAAGHVISPFDIGANGVVIVSSISAVGANPPQINWQRSGGGTLSATSKLGTEGGDATLPGGLVLAPGDSVIIAEVYYSYVPWPAEGVTEPALLYHSALFRPRFGALASLQP